MSRRGDTDLGWFIIAWGVAVLLVLLGMYAVVTFSGHQVREYYGPAPAEWGRR